jgi:hypothetical protein
MKISKLIRLIESKTGKKIFLKESKEINFLNTNNVLTEDMFADFLAKKVPYYNIWFSSLGNTNTLFLTFSFDKKETWTNGIFENSNYSRMSINAKGKMEVFTQSLYYPNQRISYETRIPIRFRKTTVKSVEDALKKLGVYIDAVKEELK